MCPCVDDTGSPGMAEILASYFYAEYEGMEWEARYNVAPTQIVPVIRQDAREPARRASLMRWGLVANWAKNVVIINNRARRFIIPYPQSTKSGHLVASMPLFTLNTHSKSCFALVTTNTALRPTTA